MNKKRIHKAAKELARVTGGNAHSIESIIKLDMPLKQTKGKRILAVKIIREVDSDPDTSYLGEYSNRPDSEYAIDRAHSEDCASVRLQTKQAKQLLIDVQENIGITQNTLEFSEDETSEYQALENAYDEVGELVDSIDECDCGFSGHWNNREYRYFNGSVENYKGEPAEDIRKYVRQDFERMESLNNGNWCYIGIRAEAEIAIPSGQFISERHNAKDSQIYTHQTISSGGLWGIESDSDSSYLESEEKDQLAELKTQLTALGFSKRAISKAFQSVERKEN